MKASFWIKQFPTPTPFSVANVNSLHNISFLNDFTYRHLLEDSEDVLVGFMGVNKPADWLEAFSRQCKETLFFFVIFLVLFSILKYIQLRKYFILV